jgi:arylsulfatase A-like enzyme
MPNKPIMSTQASSENHPNVLLILIDDQGYGDMGKHGNPILKTPNMDRLHEQSIRFTDFHVSPTCAPTRCALMTGRHEFRSGVTHTEHPGNLMDLEAVTIADVMKSGGYATGLFGKWHLGVEGAYRPEKRGFDEALTCIKDSQKYHYDPTLLRNGVEEEHKGYRTDIFFEEAIKFIEKQQDAPFFCYLATYSPHSPLVVPDKYTKPYANERYAEFFGMMANVDENVGRILQRLEELELDRTTLVILMTDNGATYDVDTWNAGMRGNKGSSFKGGTRAVSFWRLPSMFEPRDVPTPAAHIDVLPTLAELCGIDLPAKVTQQIEGINLRPLMEQPDLDTPDRIFIHHLGRWDAGPGQAERHKYFDCAVRWKQYRMTRFKNCGDDSCPGNPCSLMRRGLSTGRAYSVRSFTESRRTQRNGSFTISRRILNSSPTSPINIRTS